MLGVVKKIISDKGFGFIRPIDEKGDALDHPDYFFHASDVKHPVFELLKFGNAVEFEAFYDENRKEDKAINVKRRDNR